ncbi:MAG TPA: universal stress protein, partial [Planctomycetota bacterium]|nr:universal stress protein [Planctomycetota bacterium]
MSGTLRRILVPTDGSIGSEAVFPAIMPLVRAFAPEVEILYVFEDPESSFMPPEWIGTTCAALRTAGVNAHLKLREGVPAEEILRVARDQKVDLIALSTQGRTGVVRLIAGSVAEAVLRKSEVPLLVTRPPVVVREWKKIALALDGSLRAEEVLPDAARLARVMGATLDVIQAAEPVISGGIVEAPMVLPPEDPSPYLRGVITRLQALGVTASATALEGRASREILRHLEVTGASLLCMTTHGRSGLSRLLLGSVAEEILRKSPCPVL